MKVWDNENSPQTYIKVDFLSKQNENSVRRIIYLTQVSFLKSTFTEAGLKNKNIIFQEDYS